jgi:hypothetical protein
MIVLCSIRSFIHKIDLNKEESRCSSAFESMAFISTNVQEENAEAFKAFSELHTAIAQLRENLVRW